MTALCPGNGPSQPIPGKQTSFYLTGGALALLAQFLGIGWLAEVLGYIAGINFVLSDICATDPPADPGLTAQDIACIFAPGNPLCDSGVSLTKVSQLVARMAWSQWCQCVSGSASGLPSAPPAPSGLIQINPPSIIQPAGANICSDMKSNILGPLPNPAVTWYDNSALPGIDSNSNAVTVFKYKLLPTPTPTAFQLSIRNVVPGSNPGAINYAVYGYHVSTNTTQLLDSGTTNAGGAVDGPIVSNLGGADGLSIAVANGASQAETNTFQIEMRLFCPTNGVGGVNTLGCCPPPADLVSAVNDIHTLVTYLQRYTLPFAYINGAVHSNLSGTGSFAISRLIGVHIHVVSTSSAQGVEAANPNQLFNAGFVSIMDADGGIDERRIRYTDDVWMPRHFQEAITFGYFLEPGVVATFTELEAEP